MNRPAEKCGVFAAHNPLEGALTPPMAVAGLLSLQHRGQESAGLALPDRKGKLQVLKDTGLVTQVFSTKPPPQHGVSSVIGHVRYSTSGGGSSTNAQPLAAESTEGERLALAHNGNQELNFFLHATINQYFHMAKFIFVICIFIIFIAPKSVNNNFLALQSNELCP